MTAARGLAVAIVTTSWPETEGDPAGHFVAASARALERQGHRVVTVAPPPGGAFGWPGAVARLRERPHRLLGAAAWVARARADVRRLGADLVIAHWAVPGAWPIGMATRGRLDVVSHGGDVRLLVSLPALLRERIVRAIASRAQTWTFVSEELRDRLLGSLQPPARDAVLRVARVEAAALEMIDVRDAAARLRAELGERRTAVIVGRLVAGKRVDRAIEHVARSRELDALVVVGDGPERSRLEHLARRRGVDARFVGTLDRAGALAWIAAANVVLHASIAEGLSTVVREAEALGTPVLRL
jgi:glycosyltransferase involved in cell wall biosynthesis